MRLSPKIKDLLSEQCGRGLAAPNDCTVLALDIESKTGEQFEKFSEIVEIQPP